MQAVIFLLAMIVSIASVQAAPRKDELSIYTRGKYSQKSLHVYSEAGVRKCDTENQPPFHLKSDPFAGLIFPEQSKIRLHTNCRDTVTIHMGKKQASGCLEDEQIKPFVSKLDGICRY